jgi:integrase
VRFGRPRRREYFLSHDEQVNLLAATRCVSEDLYQISLLALATGMRKASIVTLKRSDCDLERGIISFTQKGGTRHTIPIPRDIADMLASIPDNGTPYFWVSKKSPNSHFPRNFHDMWRRVREMAGLPDSVRFHDLRHTVASLIVSRWGDLRSAQEVLGHTDIHTTQIYTHLNMEHIRDILEDISPLKEPSKTPHNRVNHK